jgi:hypothetical protein
VIKSLDKKGPHAGKFSVKYKDDRNWWTHSLLREGYGKDKHWVLLRLPSRDSADDDDDVFYLFLQNQNRSQAPYIPLGRYVP